MERVERLKILINQLCSGKNIEFARQIGITPQVLNNWFKRGLSKEAIEKIGRRWENININWLLTGEGEMFINYSVTNIKRLPKDYIEPVQVRYFEVSPSATFKEFYSGINEDPDFINVNPLPGEVLDNSYCVFEVSGESMAPQIQDGAQVLCSEVSTTRWHMVKDCVVVIAYADRFVIKRVVENNLDLKNYLILASDNPDYDDEEMVQLADIRCIYEAERIISQRIV